MRIAPMVKLWVLSPLVDDTDIREGSLYLQNIRDGHGPLSPNLIGQESETKSTENGSDGRTRSDDFLLLDRQLVA
jgi:hypothetical protein